MSFTFWNQAHAEHTYCQAHAWILPSSCMVCWKILAYMIWSLEMTIDIRFGYPTPSRIFSRSMVKLVKTMLKNTKPTRSRKTKPTHSTYHVARDSLSEVQSSTTLKAWDPFLHEHKCMRLPLMKWQMHEIFIFAWMNHFTTKGYFFDIGLSFSHSTSFIPFYCCGACFFFSHPTFFILFAISCV